MDLDLDVSMGLADSDADAEGVTDDEVVVPSPTPSVPHPLLRSSGTHDHPDGPMLGFVIREREVPGADPDAGPSLDHVRASPDRGLDLDLTSLTSLGPSVSGGEGWADWPTQHGLGGPSVSPDTGVGEYAGDGTIDPSVLGGGGGVSPSKVDDYASSPAGRREDLSRAMEEEYRMDDEEEEDVMDLLFAANGSDDDFVPPSGMGKSKGKSRAVAMDSVVNSPENVGAFQVREPRGRGGPIRFQTKLRLRIWSRMMTTITKVTKPIRVHAQYPRLRLLSSMPVPRNAGVRRPQRRHRHQHGRFATTAGASRAGPKCAVR